MSEFNPEQSHGYRERKPPKRTRRDILGGGRATPRLPERPQVRENSHPAKYTRKVFLIKGAALLGLTGLATKIGFDVFGSKEPPPPEALIQKLQQLDREILSNPQQFPELAPEIGQLALDYFNKEMGYGPEKYTGQIHYLWREDFEKKRREAVSGCIEVDVRKEEEGFVVPGSQEIVLDLTSALKTGNPAIITFMSTLHELHHAIPPMINLYDDEGNYDTINGVLVLVPSTDNSKPGLVCHQNMNGMLEEAIVQDSTNRMLKKMRIKLGSSPQYDLWEERYKKGIIDRLFKGDHKPLLELQQASQLDEFTSLIGKKLGASPEKAFSAGKNYLVDVFENGKY